MRWGFELGKIKSWYKLYSINFIKHNDDLSVHLDVHDFYQTKK